MTDYNCPVHGAYSDEGFPPSVKSCHCPGCVKEQGRRTFSEQQAFDHEYRMWNDWLLRSGVPSRGRNRTVENWLPLGRPQEAAARMLKGYANRISSEVRSGTGLTLLGPPGVGKTHLGYAIIAEAYRAGIAGRYVVWADVIDRTKASIAGRDNDNRALLNNVRECPILVLDEIGCRAGSEFDQALLFDLIDTRYRQQRATIVASNLTEDALDSIGERTADRLRETNLMVNIPGSSQRLLASSNRGLVDAPPALVEPVPPVIMFPACINGEILERPLNIRRPETF